MTELGLGVLLGVLLAARYHWPTPIGVLVGAAFGVVLYVVSAQIWNSAECWWPWHDRGGKKRKGPGRAFRRNRPCRICGNKDRRRWGGRRARDDR